MPNTTRKMSEITNEEMDQALATLHAAGISAAVLSIWERAKTLPTETEEFNTHDETDPEDHMTVAEYFLDQAEFEFYEARNMARYYWEDVREAAIRQGVTFPVDGPYGT